MSSVEKRTHTLFGCALLEEATKKLSYPPNVLASAQTLFHRFFSERTFHKTDAFTAAMACFTLGCKVEEVPIQLREVIFVFFEVFAERQRLTSSSIAAGSDLFQIWKTELINTERLVLKELGFSLYGKIDHSHQYILHIVDSLEKRGMFTQHTESLSKLAESAWYYVNESKKTDVELEFAPLAIACAAILLASKVHNIDLPDSPTDAWWDVFNVEYSAMQDICNRILDLYDLDVKPDSWIRPLFKVEYLERTAAQYGLRR